ncbi:WD40 repeat domain-containing protein [Singulisphaera sp. PoT]|uniref:WD40 repeat domain-containing protein n=1 Tax=Singulisphaera sp. PoT TaxID=3411797 RepID=UPI003BF4BEDC
MATRCSIADNHEHDSCRIPARSRERARTWMTQSLATGLLALMGWLVLDFGGEVSGRGGESRATKGHRAYPLDVAIASLAYAPDGEGLFLASRESRVMRWDLATCRVSSSAAWSWHPRVAISPDGRTLAATGSGSSIGLWDAEGGEMAGRIAIEGADSTGSRSPPTAGRWPWPASTAGSRCGMWAMA